MKKMIGLFFLLMSCSHSFAQDIANIRLSRESIYNFNAAKPKPDMEYFYYYDDKGRLSGVKYFQDGKLFDQLTNYKYDDAGRLLSYEGKNVTNTYPPRTYAFEYNDAGRRIKKTETLLREGKFLVDMTVHYNYKKDKLTRITERTTFGGNIYDTAVFTVDEKGYDVFNGTHPNPDTMLGGGSAAAEAHDWPITRFVKEDPKNYLPTFGTTYTTYKYDKNNLLSGSNWKYVHENDTGQSTGKEIYLYITLKK